MSKTKKIEFFNKLNLLQRLTQSNIYSKIIAPGSKEPFEFDMLCETEDRFSFDIQREPSEFEGLYNPAREKVEFSLWKLLKYSRNTWFIALFCTFFFNLATIGTVYCTKLLIEELEKPLVSRFELWKLFFVMLVLGVLRAVLHSNFELIQNLLASSTENFVKVGIILNKNSLNSSIFFFQFQKQFS